MKKRGTLQAPFLSFTQEMLGSPPWHHRRNKALDTSQGHTGKRLRHGVVTSAQLWLKQYSSKGLRPPRLPVTCVNVALSSSPSTAHRPYPKPPFFPVESLSFLKAEKVKEEAVGSFLPTPPFL